MRKTDLNCMYLLLQSGSTTIKYTGLKLLKTRPCSISRSLGDKFSFRTLKKTELIDLYRELLTSGIKEVISNYQ